MLSTSQKKCKSNICKFCTAKTKTTPKQNTIEQNFMSSETNPHKGNKHETISTHKCPICSLMAAIEAHNNNQLRKQSQDTPSVTIKNINSEEYSETRSYPKAKITEIPDKTIISPLIKTNIQFQNKLLSKTPSNSKRRKHTCAMHVN